MNSAAPMEAWLEGISYPYPWRYLWPGVQLLAAFWVLGDHGSLRPCPLLPSGGVSLSHPLAGLDSIVFQRTKGSEQRLTMKKSSPPGATVSRSWGLGDLSRRWGEVLGGSVLTEAVGVSWLHRVACGIFNPQPLSPILDGRFLTTRPRGKSQTWCLEIGLGVHHT